MMPMRMKKPPGERRLSRSTWRLPRNTSLEQKLFSLAMRRRMKRADLIADVKKIG